MSKYSRMINEILDDLTIIQKSYGYYCSLVEESIQKFKNGEDIFEMLNKIQKLIDNDYNFLKENTLFKLICEQVNLIFDLHFNNSRDEKILQNLNMLRINLNKYIGQLADLQIQLGSCRDRINKMEIAEVMR